MFRTIISGLTRKSQEEKRMKADILETGGGIVCNEAGSNVE
jgi:hypothetical protein